MYPLDSVIHRSWTSNWKAIGLTPDWEYSDFSSKPLVSLTEKHFSHHRISSTNVKVGQIVPVLQVQVVQKANNATVSTG